MARLSSYDKLIDNAISLSADSIYEKVTFKYILSNQEGLC